jgi:argininosuccinate synthase
MSDIKEAVLARSDGLDTEVILNCLQDAYLEYLLVGRVTG